MKQQWFIRRLGQLYGPYTQNTLNGLRVAPADVSDTNLQLTQSSPQLRKQAMSNPSPMQLAIHRDNESVGNNKVLKGCSIGFFVVILIGVVVLLVALSLIGQAIDGFFEGVRDLFDLLNPLNWSWNNSR